MSGSCDPRLRTYALQLFHPLSNLAWQSCLFHIAQARSMVHFSTSKRINVFCWCMFFVTQPLKK